MNPETAPEETPPFLSPRAMLAESKAGLALYLTRSGSGMALFLVIGSLAVSIDLGLLLVGRDWNDFWSPILMKAALLGPLYRAETIPFAAIPFGLLALVHFSHRNLPPFWGRKMVLAGVLVAGIVWGFIGLCIVGF